jgi:Tol biopolymer transport system component
MNLDHKTSAIIFVIAVLGMSVSLGAQAEQAGEKIVYNSAPEGSPPWPQEDIYSVNADGSDEKALTSDHHSHNPALSPDGKTILFIHDSKSFHQVELFLMDRDGSNVRRLLRGENIDIPAYTPAWSPDGKMIAVSYTPEEWDDNSKFGLFLVSADGKQTPRLFKEKGWGAKWSPDGKKLAYSINTSEKNWSLFLANADGSDEVELAPERAWGINWSPDGKKLAFIANPTPGMWAVHVFDLDRHQDSQLTDIKT